MASMDKLAKELKTLIDDSDSRKPKPFDTQAEVVKVDGDTAWVHIPGGVESTPVRLTTNAKKGDMVQVRIANGSGWLVGNVTAPPTDDTTANKAISISDEALAEAERASKAANTAESEALRAQLAADNAQASANQAITSASAAAQAASEADSKAVAAGQAAQNAANAASIADGKAVAAGQAAATAQSAAESAASAASVADGKAVAAGQAAESAASAASIADGKAVAAGQAAAVADGKAVAAGQAASAAQSSAQTANTAANNALTGLGVVESVIDTVNWFAEHKKLTTDTTVDSDKTYYIYDSSTGSLIKAVPTGTENPSALGWYELTDEISNYIASHVAQTDDGLFVINVANGWKVCVSSGGGVYTPGVFIIDPNGDISQATTTSGITFNSDKPFYIGDEDASIIFDGDGHITVAGSGVTFGSKSLSSVLSELNSSIKTVEYGKGSSPTSHSDITSWSTDTPIWEDGKYIWMRTTTNGLTYTYTCIQGAKGATGQQGPKGDTGATGEQGQQGPKGDTGATGQQGPQGATGEQGPKGDTGATGEQGQQGPKGDTGATGQQGPKGDTGATGQQGPQGATGEQGPKGDTGQQGPKGATGEQGPKGDTGATGNGISSVTISYASSTSIVQNPASLNWQSTIPSVPAGSYLYIRTITDYTNPSVQDTVVYSYAKQGSTGEQGPKGDTGTAGSSVTVSSIQYQEGVSPTNPPSGSWADSPVVVAEGNYLWTRTTFSDGNIAYGIAKQGEQGPQGATGQQGPKGDTGATGEQGPKGATGQQGPKGDTGATGEQGPKGATGQQGPKGDTGATGQQGPKGDTGATGEQGPKGDTGATGPKGDTGQQGPQGATGATGNGISSVTITYASSTSIVQNPASLNWQSTIPTVPAGSYLYIRTITDYTDPTVQDTVVYSYAKQGSTGEQGPQGATGQQGPKGDTGATGQQGPKGDTGTAGSSVTVSSIKYQEGTSPTNPPSGSWSDSPVVVAEGKYLWTKTTFSDGNVAYGIAKQGQQGPQGATGQQGPKGDTGATGQQGPQGDTGQQGPKGDTGPQGATGQQGPQGATGQQGLRGATGDTGPEAVVNIEISNINWTANTATLTAVLRVNGVIKNASSPDISSISYTWIKGTTTISGATTSSISITDLNAVYYCTITWT